MGTQDKKGAATRAQVSDVEEEIAR